MAHRKRYSLGDLKRAARQHGGFALAHLIVSPERAAWIEAHHSEKSQMGRPSILVCELNARARPPKPTKDRIKYEQRVDEIDLPPSSEDSEDQADSEDGLRKSSGCG
jgi:hypothetical protein